MRPLEIREMIRDNYGRKDKESAIADYITEERRDCIRLNPKELESRLVSAANWRERHEYESGLEMGVYVSPGDICFLDYGRSYIKEAGYQHFGLIVSICGGKAFIVPMTSNANTYAKAYDEETNPLGCKHLFPLGDIEGLYRKSVLFLNDGKYMNTARVIDVKAHVNPDSVLFQKIKERLRECLNLL